MILCFDLVPTALSLEGKLQRIVDNESEFEQFVQEIEQYDYLMEDSTTAIQTRKYERCKQNPRKTKKFSINLIVH